MLTRLQQVLRSDDRDDPTHEVLRRFWGRAPGPTVQPALPRPPVVDLAQWVRSRREARR